MKVISMNGPSCILQLQQGADFQINLGTAEEPCVDYAGDPIDFTGCTFLFQVRDSSDAIIATLTVTSPAPGRLQAGPVNTASWPVGGYLFDCSMADSGGGDSWPIERSTLSITPRASR